MKKPEDQIIDLIVAEATKRDTFDSITGYKRQITTAQAADNWGVSRKTVLAWISRGKLPQAVKMGRDWFIPEDAARPADNRYVDNPIHAPAGGRP